MKCSCQTSVIYWWLWFELCQKSQMEQKSTTIWMYSHTVWLDCARCHVERNTHVRACWLVCAPGATVQMSLTFADGLVILFYKHGSGRWIPIYVHSYIPSLLIWAAAVWQVQPATSRTGNLPSDIHTKWSEKLLECSVLHRIFIFQIYFFFIRNTFVIFFLSSWAVLSCFRLIIDSGWVRLLYL